MHLFESVNGDFEFEDDDNLCGLVDLDDCWSGNEEEEEEEEEESVMFPSIVEEALALAQKAMAFCGAAGACTTHPTGNSSIVEIKAAFPAIWTDKHTYIIQIKW